MCLNLESQFFFDRHFVVQECKKTKKSGKLIPIVQVTAKILVFFEHLNEDSHDVGENGNTKQKNKSTKYSFKIATWVIVTKANC